MSINLLFDGRMMNMSGIGRYSQELSGNLFSKDKKFNNVTILTNDSSSFLQNGAHTVKSKVFSVSEQFEMYKFAKNKRGYIFHSPHFLYPLAYKDPLILTVHDITPILFPKIFSKAGRLYMKFFLDFAKDKADKIITVSNQTKLDLMNHFQIPEEKIQTIYNGVDLAFFNDYSLDNNNYDNKYKYKDYILYAGNIRPHKNLETLIKALNVLHSQNRKIPLIIIGQTKNSYEELNKLIFEYKLQEYVKFTGWVENEELKYLYQNATVFAYPSLYEGFGLPPLEAMACGTPVVTTNVSSIPEVVGDAALQVSPLDFEEMAYALNGILESKSLQEDLSQKGLERVKLFQWDKTASEVYEVYEEVWNNRMG